jgi:hypothetical protein
MPAKDLQFVGTSATLATGGTHEEQRAEIAKVSSVLFGDEVKPDYVIGETLRRATPDVDLSDQAFRTELSRRIEDPSNILPKDYESFVTDPLSIWLESTFGVEGEHGTGRLIRKQPRSITGDDGAAKLLSQLTGVPYDRCTAVIEEGLPPLSHYLRCPRHLELGPTIGFARFGKGML